MIKRVFLSSTLLTALSHADFDIEKSIAEGARSGLGSVSGWIVLAIIIALIFAFLTKR